MNDEPASFVDVPEGKSRKHGMITDKGKVRETDEDCVQTSSFSGAFGTIHFFAVADGMGGHAKGEVASKIAQGRVCVDAISKMVLPELLTATLADLLKKGYKEANDRIIEYTKTHPEASGMGTTCVSAIVHGNYVTLANVGDSRAYVISDTSGIRQETTDHSLVQQMVDNHVITPAQARDHPEKNVITRAIGISSTLEVDTLQVTLQNDESLLLCCDGVTAHLTDPDIQKIVQETPDPDVACRKIVDMANERGGSDNISLIILSKPSALDVEVTKEDRKSPEEMKTVKKQNAESRTADNEELLKEKMRDEKNQLKLEKDIAKQEAAQEKVQETPSFFTDREKTSTG